MNFYKFFLGAKNRHFWAKNGPKNPKFGTKRGSPRFFKEKSPRGRKNLVRDPFLREFYFLGGFFLECEKRPPFSAPNFTEMAVN